MFLSVAPEKVTPEIVTMVGDVLTSTALLPACVNDAGPWMRSIFSMTRGSRRLISRFPSVNRMVSPGKAHLIIPRSDHSPGSAGLSTTSVTVHVKASAPADVMLNMSRLMNRIKTLCPFRSFPPLFPDPSDATLIQSAPPRSAEKRPPLNKNSDL